jgi:nitrous oxidase accessory protein NosD
MTDKPKMPRNSGILIDSCRDALVEGNTVVGFDEGVTDRGSERSKILRNRIYRGKPPKQD